MNHWIGKYESANPGCKIYQINSKQKKQQSQEPIVCLNSFFVRKQVKRQEQKLKSYQDRKQCAQIVIHTIKYKQISLKEEDINRSLIRI